MSEGSSGPLDGGRRRIDRVLAEGFLDDLQARELADVRAMRREAEQEEVDLSYVRRLVQGRADIIRAEQARRAGGDSDESVVEHLAQILSEHEAGHTPHGLGRFLTVEPSRVDEHRRAVEQIVSDVGISDVEARTDEELAGALSRLEAFEVDLSAQRRRVQDVMDSCTAEIGRRYQVGEARVDDLLGES
jgi:hypothetical protein